jgi:hypothetical protein
MSAIRTRKRLRLLFHWLVILALLMRASSSIAQNTGENTQPKRSTLQQIEDVLNGVAEGVFKLAWPIVSSYEGYDLPQITPTAQGYDASVKLHGQGIARNPDGTPYVGALWLKLTFHFDRNVHFINYAEPESNAAFPPFATSKLGLEEVSSLVEEFMNASSSGGESGNIPQGSSLSPHPVNISPPSPISIPINANPVLQNPPGDKGPGIRSGAELLSALDNSLWIADGPASDRQMYIIASPCDVFSRSLFMSTREVVNTVQLRWIEMPTDDQECRDALGSIARGDADFLDSVYVTGKGPAAAPQELAVNAIRWNLGVENAASPILKFMRRQGNATLLYPTLIWVSNGRIEARVRPAEIDSIFHSVDPRPSATDFAPMSRMLMTATFDYRPQSKQAMAKFDRVKLYSMPDERSQVTSTIPKDAGYPIASEVKFNGEKWFELQCAPKPWLPNLFVRESDVYRTK